ncbi:hypothetical protein LNA01_27560 [Companilactobacillus nantensis]|nr:hypothetical protein LNA01_27560 [Companilactobacillus nantensis]
MYPTDKPDSDVWRNDTEVSRGHSSHVVMKDRTLINLINMGGRSGAKIAENRTKFWPVEEAEYGIR